MLPGELEIARGGVVLVLFAPLDPLKTPKISVCQQKVRHEEDEDQR